MLISRSRLRELEQRRESARQQLAQARALSERFNTERSQTQVLRDDAALRQKRAEERRRVLEAELAQADDKISAARTALLAAEEELRRRTEENRRVNEDVLNREAMADKSREAVRIQRETVNSIAAELETLTRSLLSMHATHGDREAEITRLLALRALSRAVDTARALVADNELQVGELKERVQRSRQTAPTVEPLPEFEIPSEWLPRVPQTAPTVEPLPEFTIPQEWLESSDTARPQHADSYLTDKKAMKGTEAVKLAETGGNALPLLGFSIAGASMGVLFMKRRRNSQER